MKTVIGTVVSSKPISLSVATSVMSKFVASENGASQANSAYLRRTLAAFKELKQLHKDLKIGSSSKQNKKRHRSGDRDAIEEAITMESEPKRKKHRK